MHLIVSQTTMADHIFDVEVLNSNMLLVKDLTAVKRAKLDDWKLHESECYEFGGNKFRFASVVDDEGDYCFHVIQDKSSKPSVIACYFWILENCKTQTRLIGGYEEFNEFVFDPANEKVFRYYATDKMNKKTTTDILTIRVEFKGVDFSNFHRLDNDYRSLIKNRFAFAFEAGQLLDVTFVVDGQELKASKLVLIVMSTVFAAMFDGEWKEAKDNRIDISGTSYKAMDIFIKLMHGIDFQPLADDVDLGLELILLADKYAVKEIGLFIGKQLVQFVDKENVVKLLEIGCQVNIDVLKKAGCAFVKSKPVAQLTQLPGYESLSYEALALLLSSVYDKLKV